MRRCVSGVHTIVVARVAAVTAAGLAVMLVTAPVTASVVTRDAATAFLSVWTSGGSAVARSAPGFSFTNVTTANGLGSDDVRGVYAIDDSIFAATAGGLSVSSDGGVTFTNYTTAHGLGSNDVVGVSASNDTIYAATFGGGLGISLNGGATFTNRTTVDGLGDDYLRGVYAVDDSVFASTGRGLSISTDGGATFVNDDTTSGLGSDDVYGAYVAGGTIYAATPNGLGVSTDGAVTFSNRTTADGLGDNDVRGVYAIGGAVYAALPFVGLSISSDSGATFTNRTSANGLGADNARGVYVVGSTVYAATPNGLSISSDGGTTFTNYTTAAGLRSNDVRGVYAVGGTVYAATSGGLSIGVPALVSSASTASIVSGSTATATISGAGLAIPDGTVVSAVSAAPGVATVTASVNAAGGIAAFTLTGITVGASHVTFSATGYADVVVAVSVSAPAPSPGPAPSSPPSAPLLVTGVAGDGSVLLTWVAPVSPGAFPVSTYQAVVSPGGQSCLVSAPTLTCVISGLSNGATYTAMVRALNGGGWGPYSEASATFTPESPIAPTITITGTRGDVRGKPGIRVAGATVGFGMGAILRPWIRFPRQASYTQGSASILGDVQGGFTWERRTGKTIYISIRSEDDAVESNRIVIRSR